jgi:hypothetical protein
MEFERSQLFLREPATGTHLESDESSPNVRAPFISDQFNIIQLLLRLPSVPFP